jgi:predicted nucleic acid-binding protein
MESLTCLIDSPVVIVADASAVINLNATGRAQDIVKALPNRLAVVDVVQAELEQGRRRDWQDADLLNELVAAGLIDLVRLGEAALQHFEKLVVGPAASTLDDGEAATVAYAMAHHAIPIVDERKAHRICAEQFAQLRVGCTVDILTHPQIVGRLGAETLADAVFKALYYGRMRVFPHHVKWVLGVIGAERAALCTSLPRSIRPPLAKSSAGRDSS